MTTLGTVRCQHCNAHLTLTTSCHEKDEIARGFDQGETLKELKDDERGGSHSGRSGDDVQQQLGGQEATKFSPLSSRLEESFLMLEELYGRRRDGHEMIEKSTPSSPRMDVSSSVSQGTLEESFIMLSRDQHFPRQYNDAAANAEWADAIHDDVKHQADEVIAVNRGTKTSMNAQSGMESRRSHQQRFSLEDRMETMMRLLELASDETAIDQPLCPDCASEVMRELQNQVEELEEELDAYNMLDERLKKEMESLEDVEILMDEKKFKKALQTMQDELRDEEKILADTESKLKDAQEKKIELEETICNLDKIEQRYWHACNAVMLALHAAEDQRDALQSRLDAAEQSSSLLRRTNVLNDVFYICPKGPFGTISGLRLGSMPDDPVEWQEINAAWGQAILLLDSLARSLKYTFPERLKLEPRGSYSRVHDANNINEIFGPVNKLFCYGYDRAQVGFLQCLKYFAHELKHQGVLSDGKPFEVPYNIENDRIGGQSIRYGLSRDRAWTKALKYMLVDLKFCLKGTLSWLDQQRMAGSTAGGPIIALPPEGPA